MNVYNTNDPAKLLELKRQEADALRDVIRSIHGSHLKPEQFFKITQNVLLAQLRVRKMKFIYKLEDEFVTGLNWRLDPITDGALEELPNISAILPVTEAEHPELQSLGIEYIVPLYFKRGVAAWFLVAEFADSDAERENDLIFIETIGNVLTSALENYFLVEEIVQQEAVKRELDVASKIQNQLLISDFSAIDLAEIYAVNVQHQGVGGDFYDVISRGEKGFIICIADVAGKGISASLLMANLQANLRALILSENSLESIIRKLHDRLMDVTKGERFVTLFLAHIKADTRTMDYINAGHNPPVLVSNGEIIELTDGTIPLGILDLPEIIEGEVPFHDGDLLFLYTDGLVEQPGPGEELFGEERVESALLEANGKTPEQIITGMNDLRVDFTDGHPSEDDITMVAVRFRN